MVGCFDVPLLAAFIAAAQKNDERLPAWWKYTR
jgi:hypothetical protein